MCVGRAATRVRVGGNYHTNAGGRVVLTGEKGLVGSHLADHAMALLLALTRQLAAAVRDGPASWDQRMAYRRREIDSVHTRSFIVLVITRAQTGSIQT